MAKRTRPARAADRRHTLTLRLPPAILVILDDAARVSGLTVSQLATAILALRLVTLKREKP
jgi:hypothetical protein